MKNFLTISVLLVLLVLSKRASAHDIHISYSQAELKGNELRVKVSYYKDDFTKAVKNWYQGKADNLSSAEFQSAECEYVKNYFRVGANGDYRNLIMPKPLKVADDGTSIIFELSFSCDSFHSIIIDQRVLFKEYADQMNIFFIKAFGKEENHIFTPGKPTVVIKP
jgi:hypothetical protein